MPPSGEDHAADPHTVTVLALLNDVLRRRWTVATLVVGCAVASAVVRLAMPRTYTAEAAFVAESIRPLGSTGAGVDSPLGALSSLGRASSAVGGASALSVGSGLASREPAEKVWDPEVYWTMLRTRQLLLSVAARRFTISTPHGPRSGELADVYGLPPGAPAQRRENAVRRLEREMTVTYDLPTDVMTVSIRTSDAELARALAQALLDEITAQNRRMADARSSAQVAFMTKAEAEARRELRGAQDGLQRFLAANRAFGPASRLALDFRRLDDAVRELSRRHTALALELERARIDRSRATQVIAIVRRPEAPARPDARGVVLGTLFGAVGGAAVALLVVLTSAHLSRLRTWGSDELSALADEWRRLGRRRTSRSATSLGSGPLDALPEG